MTTKFNLTRDINGVNGFGLPFSDTAYNTILSANSEQHFTVPANMGMGASGTSYSSQWIALFNFDPGTRVWVADNVTAAIPGSSFAATNSELNPAARMVQGGDVLSFITADTSVSVSVSLYSLD